MCSTLHTCRFCYGCYGYVNNVSLTTTTPDFWNIKLIALSTTYITPNCASKQICTITSIFINTYLKNKKNSAAKVTLISAKRAVFVLWPLQPTTILYKGMVRWRILGNITDITLQSCCFGECLDRKHITKYLIIIK